MHVSGVLTVTMNLLPETFVSGVDKYANPESVQGLKLTEIHVMERTARELEPSSAHFFETIPEARSDKGL